MTIDDPFWVEEIERARKVPGTQKMLSGPDLFDYACEIALAGIRWQNPGISNEDARKQLRARLALAEKLEDGL